MKRCLYLLVVAVLILSIQAGSASAQNYYIVKSGDTLWDIANKHGVSVNSLKQSNSLASDRLQIGMKLTINNPQARGLDPAVTSNQVYVVRNGDNLWTIARKFNMTVEQLQSLNNLSSERLDIGDKLRVKGSAAAVTPSRALYTQQPVKQETAPESEATTESVTGVAICEFGAQYLGTPYHYGGSSPSGFDCSGFVGFVFKEFGHSLPRTAVAISGVGTSVDKSDLQIGDLVFFQGPGASCINHVGIFAGNNQFIHSSSGKVRGVTYSSLDAYYYHQYYAGAKRILAE